jgi:putative peptidoglycan lipid II flippase
VQLNIFIGTRFASTDQGAVSWLAFAFRILYLPIGIFGVAAGTVATAGLARRVAEGDLDGVRSTLHHSLRNLLFLTLPATVGLVVLAVPIVRLLFERGLFTPYDTDHTAIAVALYAIGLVAYTGVKVLAPAFYALDSPRVPLVASASAVATNLVLILALHPRLGYRAIALGTALGSCVNGLVLLVVLHRRLGSLGGRGLLTAFVKMSVAAAVMVPVCLVTLRWTEAWLGTRGLLAQIVTGLVPIGAGGGAYLLAAWGLRLPEVHALGSLFRRR